MNLMNAVLARKIAELSQQIPYLRSDECYPALTISSVSLRLTITDSKMNLTKTAEILFDSSSDPVIQIIKLESDLITLSKNLFRSYTNKSDAEQASRCKKCMWHGHKNQTIERAKFRNTPLYICSLCDSETEKDPNARYMP